MAIGKNKCLRKAAKREPRRKWLIHFLKKIVSLADLQKDKVTFRKLKLITEDVQGKNCLTNFHGMDLTHGKMCSMVKKWQPTIEAHDVKTTDGYLLRLFCVGLTKKHNNQIRKTSNAQHQQVHQIQKKMTEIMTREGQTNGLKEVVNKLIPDSIGKDRKGLPVHLASP
ncbi:40S ribosomal protein S3a [Tupaia chinensis]|uniref:40S ribosomal protein S3a n=1 Tax=Tupaia chinensis TaxID=246437 RepID=L9KHW0_TUPCH|nr:40S ribosomal protein S3a [Tupaia chinensis]